MHGGWHSVGISFAHIGLAGLRRGGGQTGRRAGEIVVGVYSEKGRHVCRNVESALVAVDQLAVHDFGAARLVAGHVVQCVRVEEQHET